ncbi:MAG: hypothetical protein ACRDOG_16745 [Gaiellaceae bacterium]
MSVSPSTIPTLETLSKRELDALVDAAAWYAKYHHRMIADLADDPSAMAIARRDRFRDLHDALGRLGIRLLRPDGLEAA